MCRVNVVIRCVVFSPLSSLPGKHLALIGEWLRLRTRPMFFCQRCRWSLVSLRKSERRSPCGAVCLLQGGAAGEQWPPHQDDMLWLTLINQQECEIKIVLTFTEKVHSNRDIQYLLVLERMITFNKWKTEKLYQPRLVNLTTINLLQFLRLSRIILHELQYGTVDLTVNF